MDTAWLEGFVKAAAARGLTSAETDQLLKAAQRLRLLKQNPERYAEGYNTIWDKKSQVKLDPASIGTSDVPGYEVPVSNRAAGLYGGQAMDIKAKPVLTSEDTKRLEYLTNRATGQPATPSEYSTARAQRSDLLESGSNTRTPIGDFLSQHRWPIGIGLGAGAAGLGALLASHVRRKREEEEAKAQALRSPART
jgi:hypothetical protein